jgi:hypothetical protein
MRLLHLIIPVFFLAFGAGILLGWIFPGMPQGTGMREMLGIVTVLFGLYRGAAFFFAPPAPRRPYGGFREQILGKKDKISAGEHETKDP